MSEPNEGSQALEQVKGRREMRVVESEVALFDTGMFEHMQRVARAMSMASVMPDHLRVKPYFFPKNGSLAPAELAALRQSLGEAEWNRAWQEAERKTEANCFLVVNQAQGWRMSPFAVANASYVVGGKLAFEGKLVGGVVNSLGRLSQKLWYEFEGEGLDRKITVHATREGETKDRTVEVVVRDVKTDNQMWARDPDQKLVYNGNIKWARRHVPELLLGLVFDDDIEQMEKNVTPDADARIAGPGVAGLEARIAAKTEPVIEVVPSQEGDRLTEAQLAEIRALAAADPVIEITELEGKLGEFIHELRAGKGETLADVMGMVTGLLAMLKAQKAETKKAEAASDTPAPSLFGDAPPASGPTTKKK